ncbi:MAG TPA: hypothetical protein PKZ82_12195, partial [Microthrixaceae bacterium]|nr:hypothetical protein [Microthrixaceae bacterium]
MQDPDSQEPAPEDTVDDGGATDPRPPVDGTDAAALREQVRDLEDEVSHLVRRLQDAPKRVRTL